MIESYDKIVIGAGLYGLYAAVFCAKQGQRVLLIECEDTAFSRASRINQARVHQGYHYPRSLYTAKRSASYFERFCRDFHFCINESFEQVYATSKNYSWTNRDQFLTFCRNAGIPCKEVQPDRYFKKGLCDGAYITREYAYDAELLKQHFLNLVSNTHSIKLDYGTVINRIEKEADRYLFRMDDQRTCCAPFVLNATYAGTNHVLQMADLDLFQIKYELCEIILCEVGRELDGLGLTVMDGPFFSIMPFGKTGLHSLTSVTFTPHETSYDTIPAYSCMNGESLCQGGRLGNCNLCGAHPQTAFPFMDALTKKYLLDKYEYYYKGSLYTIKPILTSSEIDDSRPTVIRIHSKKPYFVSVLSGKINTVYDLDEVLAYEE